MKKADQTPRRSGLFFTGITAVTCAFLGLANTAIAQQTLQLEIPFTDTGAGMTAAATVSTLGPVSLSLVNNAGTAASFYGVPGSGIEALSVALDFSTNADFTGTAPGEGSVAGNGPLASVTSTNLNYGAFSNFTASMWFNPNAELSFAVTTGPRLFILGTNGTADKAAANSIGLYYQQSNEVAATVGTVEINPTAGTTGPVLAPNQWYFFAVTFDGTTANIYEGSESSSAVLVGTSTAALGTTINLGNASDTNGATLQIGNRANRARPFDGWINDFRFYTGTASSSAVEDIRVSGANLPGMGGVNKLVNPLFDGPTLTTAGGCNGNSTTPSGWTVTAVGTGNDGVSTTNGGPTSGTYYNAGVCPPDSPAEFVSTYPPGNSNVAKMYASFCTANVSPTMSQTFQTAPTAVWEAGAWTYVSHEDLITGNNSYYYAVNFMGTGGTLLATYESLIITNESCSGGGTFPLDTWVFLPVTNQMKVTGGVATGAVIGTEPSGQLTAPPGTVNVQFEAVYNCLNYAGGSVYWDDAYLGFVTGPLPPTLTTVSPNLVTLCTNTALTCTASSPLGTITNVEVIVQSTTLGGPTTTPFVTNTLTSPSLTVGGIGTSTVDISYALTTNVVYLSVVVIVTDNNGINAASPSVSLDTLAPALVIEASDFNFNGGQFIDTAPNGGLGLYANASAPVELVDFLKTGAQNTLYYRTAPTSPYTVTIQPAAPGAGGSATEQKFVTAAAEGDTNAYQTTEYEVGYNSAGDWLDYTRTYGDSSTNSAPAGTYNVWAYVATLGGGTASGFYQIAGDPTTQDQSSNFVGYVSTQTFTDNGWNTYKYVPLVDQFGNLVSITISNGPQTLRNTMIGNFNMGFYMLMPSTPVVTPLLKYLYPEGLHPFEYTNKFVATVGPANGAPISASGIDLVLNGVDVTAGATITSGSAGQWTITYPLALNTPYSGGVLTVSNTANLSSAFVISPFDTFNISNYQWEAVDYDFSLTNGTGPSAQYIDNPVPTGDVTSTTFGGPPETNSYYFYPADVFGNAALQGVDINFGNSGQPSNPYRVDGVGAQPSADYVRPKFLAARTAYGDPNIGPFNLGYYAAGYWLNYTRDYPPGNYYVWGRLAGGAGPFSGTTIGIVTSGVGTSTQTYNVVGSFADPNAAGWQVWHWIELMSNGAPAIVSLPGKATLNITSGNNINAEYFMLVAGPLTLSASLANGNLLISVPTTIGNSYQVWETPSLSPASWSPVGSLIPGTGSVVISTNSIIGQQGYFKVTTQ